MFRYDHYLYCLRDLINFGLKVSRHFRPKNYKSKNGKILKSSCIFSCPKMSQYPQIINCRHELKAFLPLPTNFYFNFYLIKVGFIPFFASSDMHQPYHLVGCHATDIKSLLISFLHELHCLHILRLT